MRRNGCCLVLLFLLTYLHASAISVPPATPLHVVYGDSTLTVASHQNKSPAAAKKVGLFRKMKYRLLSLVVKKQVNSEGKADTKSLLGWISLGMVLISLGFFIAGVSGVGVGLLFLAGIITGIVSLFWKKKTTASGKKKKSNTAAIIAIVLAIVFIAGIAIILSGS